MTTVIDTETYGDLVRTEFPNGSAVFYRDSDHSYWREAKPKGAKWSGSGRLTGVSTLCGPYDFRPDNLMRWSARLAVDGVARAYGKRSEEHDPPAVPADPYLLTKRLEGLGLCWWQIRDVAADRGTNVHALMLHALAAGEEVPDLSKLPDDQRGYGQAVMRWWIDREPEVSHAEQTIASLEHGFAGTLDLRCKIKDPLRPGYGIVDAKTSGFLSGKMFVQPAGYDLGVVDSGLGDPAEWLMILQLRADGTYREVWSDATHEDFLGALRIYRREAEFSKVARAVTA